MPVLGEYAAWNEDPGYNEQEEAFVQDRLEKAHGFVCLLIGKGSVSSVEIIFACKESEVTRQGTTHLTDLWLIFCGEVAHG
jgi:hypothetical protein